MGDGEKGERAVDHEVVRVAVGGESVAGEGGRGGETGWDAASGELPPSPRASPRLARPSSIAQRRRRRRPARTAPRRAMRPRAPRAIPPHTLPLTAHWPPAGTAPGTPAPPPATRPGGRRRGAPQARRRRARQTRRARVEGPWWRGACGGGVGAARRPGRGGSVRGSARPHTRHGGPDAREASHYGERQGLPRPVPPRRCAIGDRATRAAVSRRPETAAARHGAVLPHHLAAARPTAAPATPRRVIVLLVLSIVVVKEIGARQTSPTSAPPPKKNVPRRPPTPPTTRSPP